MTRYCSVVTIIEIELNLQALSPTPCANVIKVFVAGKYLFIAPQLAGPLYSPLKQCVRIQAFAPNNAALVLTDLRGIEQCEHNRCWRLITTQTKRLLLLFSVLLLPCNIFASYYEYCTDALNDLVKCRQESASAILWLLSLISSP